MGDRRRGCDVRPLRARLGLDSGYLSRLLRSLEADGLVQAVELARDRRVRTVRLTPRAAERALLDRRSDELAARCSIRSGAQRERLVAAMARSSGC